MNRVYVEAVGVAAPGLSDWSLAQALLRGEQPYIATPLAAFTPTVLPANEQRRATATVRLAFRVAEEAIRNSTHAPDTVATVFASSDADMMVSHRICTALAQSPRLVSPTDFHNSVHNAPSGYWHIGAHSRLPSSAVAGYDHSLAVGLIEAYAQVRIEQTPTLLVCYDVPAPPPLLERRPLGNPCAVALLLTSSPSANALAGLRIDFNAGPETTLTESPLEALRLSNPAARALPLLQCLALKQSGVVHLRRSASRCLQLHIEPI